MKKLGIFACLFILLGSCNDDLGGELNEGTITQNLEGHWFWEYSTGGISGNTIRPGTAYGFLRHTITFNHGVASVRVDNDSEDGLLIRISSFQVGRVADHVLGPQMALLYGENQLEEVPDIGGVVDFFMNPAIISLQGNTLVLGDDCHDCYTHTFSRVRTTPQ